MITFVGSRARRRSRVRIWLGVIAALAAVLAGLVVAVYLAWPQVRLDSASDALVRIALPSFAGEIVATEVRSEEGRSVPVRLSQGKLWPRRMLDVGERLTVALTVRRPGWVAF